MDLNSVKGILEAYSSNEITLDLATALINAIKEKETKCESKEKSSIEKKLEDFIKSDILSCLYHEDFDDEFDEEKNLTPNDICKYMKSCNWKWRGKEVTVEMFTSEVKRLVVNCITEILNEYKEDDMKEDGYSWNVETGGIRVHCFLNNEDYQREPTIDVEISFIMQEWHTYFNFNDIIKL